MRGVREGSAGTEEPVEKVVEEMWWISTIMSCRAPGSELPTLTEALGVQEGQEGQQGQEGPEGPEGPEPQAREVAQQSPGEMLVQAAALAEELHHPAEVTLALQVRLALQGQEGHPVA